MSSEVGGWWGHWIGIPSVVWLGAQTGGRAGSPSSSQPSAHASRPHHLAARPHCRHSAGSPGARVHAVVLHGWVKLVGACAWPECVCVCARACVCVCVRARALVSVRACI
eukprot:15470508-Alexandrium_andersonii.AAC.1